MTLIEPKGGGCVRSDATVSERRGAKTALAGDVVIQSVLEELLLVPCGLDQRLLTRLRWGLLYRCTFLLFLMLHELQDGVGGERKAVGEGVLLQLVEPDPDLQLALLDRLQLVVLLSCEIELFEVLVGGLVDLAARLVLLLLE